MSSIIFMLFSNIEGFVSSMVMELDPGCGICLLHRTPQRAVSGITWQNRECAGWCLDTDSRSPPVIGFFPILMQQTDLAVWIALVPPEWEQKIHMHPLLDGNTTSIYLGLAPTCERASPVNGEEGQR